MENLRRTKHDRPSQTCSREAARRRLWQCDPAKWHYTQPINLAEAQREHDALAAMLKQAGAEVIYHDVPLPDHADAIFVFDPRAGHQRAQFC